MTTDELSSAAITTLSIGFLSLLLWTAALPATAATEEVTIKLPARARLDLSGRDSLAPATCMVVSREGEGRVPGSDVDVQKELQRYLSKIIRRLTDLRLIETGRLDYPTYDLAMLARDRDFWRALGERTQADLVLGCSLDFDIQDRSGYRSEQFTSPADGRTYERRVLVEETGFEYDIVLQVYDGRSGELLFSDNFKDFQSFSSDHAEPMTNMFQHLYAFEDWISAVFTETYVEAARLLFIE